MHISTTHLKKVKGKPDRLHIQTQHNDKKNQPLNWFVLATEKTLFREHAKAALNTC